jgi:hypothetical protein
MRVRSSQYTSPPANRAVHRTSRSFVPIIWLAGEYQPHPATQVASGRAHSSRRWDRVNRGQVVVLGTSTLRAKACGDGGSSVIYPISRPVLHKERGMPRAYSEVPRCIHLSLSKSWRRTSFRGRKSHCWNDSVRSRCSGGAFEVALNWKECRFGGGDHITSMLFRLVKLYASVAKWTLLKADCA